MKEFMINGRPWKAVVGGAVLTVAAWAAGLTYEVYRESERAVAHGKMIDWCWAVMAMGPNDDR